VMPKLDIGDGCWGDARCVGLGTRAAEHVGRWQRLGSAAGCSCLRGQQLLEELGTAGSPGRGHFSVPGP